MAKNWVVAVLMYEMGRKVEADFVKEVRVFRLAPNQGVYDGHVRLGLRC